MRSRMRSLAIIVIFVTLTLAITGCLGRTVNPPAHLQTGIIKGTVVDSAGTGVAGVLVAVQGTSIATMTDVDGSYVLPNVPSGTQTVVVEFSPTTAVAMSDVGMLSMSLNADNPRLMLDGQPIPWNAIAEEPAAETISFTIPVQPNSVSMAETVKIPVFGAVDNLFLYHATPRIGSSLTAGRSATFALDVNYSLQSSEIGHVVAVFLAETPEGVEYEITQRSLRIEKGTGTAPLSHTMVIPVARHVDIMLGLVDANGKVLAIKYYAVYPIEGGSVPFAPELTALGFADHHVSFSVHGGNPIDFARYELYASNSASRAKCWDPSPIWTSDDPKTEIIHVRPFTEGEPNYYRLCLVTQDGRSHSGNLVTHTTPLYGVKRIQLRRSIGGMAADPVRDRLYLTDQYYNEVLVVSTVTDTILRLIPVGQAPGAMAVSDDGSYLYVAHSGGDTVAVIDLYSFEVIDWIEGGQRPSALAINPYSNHLYVASRDGSHAIVSAIDLATRETLFQRTYESSYVNRLDVLDSGRLLFVNTHPAHILDANDFTEVAELQRSQSVFNQPVVVGDRLYVTRYVYDANSYAQLGELRMHTVALNASEQRLYAFGAWRYGEPMTGSFNTLYELSNDPGTGEWQPTARVYLTDEVHMYADVLLLPDADLLYVPIYHRGNSQDLVVIDLAVRRDYTPR